MDATALLGALSAEMHLEAAEDACCPQGVRRPEEVYIFNAVTPGGKGIRLLKTLLSSACERNCFYCPFRAGRDFHRATFKPDELAGTFMALHQAGIAEGIFLSSGLIGGGVRTQDLLIDSAEILRHKLGFRGYVHLKIMPGAEHSQVERAMQLADRVSINLEAPNAERLSLLAPTKQYLHELLEPLRWVEEIRRNQPPHKAWNGRWPSSTTQFVVGAVGESDLELLTTTEALYKHQRLQRAYFSAFKPATDTPFEGLPPESSRRELRLYQASFLLRDYPFELDELLFDANGRLPEDVDPKYAWASAHLKHSPVEINRASREELLRLPGVGPRTSRALLQARRATKINDLSQLKRLGVNPARVAPFILLNGKRPAYQASLW